MSRSRSSYTALPWIDLIATNVMARFPEENGDYHVNVFGIPTVVSARKGWPNFNEFHLQTSVQVTRRLEAYKPTVSSAPRLNQSYEIGISNLFGVESWNSYTQAFPRAVELVVTNLCTVALRDELRPLATRVVSSRVVTNNYFTNITAGAWRAQEFSLASRVVQLVPNSEYWPLRTPPFRQLDGGIAFDETAGFPTPDLRLEITNRLTAVMLATDRSGAKRVVDFVNLDYLRGGMNITAGLVGRS